MNHVRFLECVRCGARYEPGEVRYTCPEHDGVAGILDVVYDPDTVAARFDATLDGRVESMWKYAAFLPIPDDAEPVTLAEGGTPLLRAPRLGDELGLEAWVKDDGRNPTGVLKDRASSVAVTRARAAGAEVVTCASTGNAAASLAGYAARAGLDCRIFVPGDAPEAKLAQPLVYGADVLAVEGSYDEAYDLSVEITSAYGWYNRNAAINPYQVEGKRTVGHELADQWAAPDGESGGKGGSGDAPDWLAVAMGDGCTVAGAWKGYREFAELGFVEETPRLLGVQAAGASAIHDAFHDGDWTDSEADAATVADSIAVERPRNTVKACRAIADSDGTAVVVDDDELLEAESLLGRSAGVYAEPAAAAPVAGALKAREEGVVAAGESIALLVTGTGLKDTDGALAAAGEPTSVAPSLEAIEALYGPGRS